MPGKQQMIDSFNQPLTTFFFNERMTAHRVVFAVFAAYILTLGRSTTVERSGHLCMETGSASDELMEEYGVRLFAPVISSRRSVDPLGSSRSQPGALNPHRIASVISQDPVLHALYRPEPAADYHVVIHPLFTARDAAAWWNQTWQTALASRWRALALIRKELAHDPVTLHPVVRGLHAGRYTISIELTLDGEEHTKLMGIWSMVQRISGVTFGYRTPADGSFVLRIPIGYRRIDPDSGKCCFCCPSRSTLSVITGKDNAEVSWNDWTEECCMPLGDADSDVQKRLEERLNALMQGVENHGDILPIGSSIRVGTVQMGHFRRQGEMLKPKHWAIHYLLPGGRDERFPMGALLCLICPIVIAMMYYVVKLRKVPLMSWDVKRR